MDRTRSSLLTLVFAGLCLPSCTSPERVEPERAPSVPPDRRAPQDLQRTASRTPTPAATTPSLQSRLGTERIGRVAFTAENGDLREVARYIQTVTGIPVIVTPSARRVIDDEGLVLVLELIAPITVENLLNFMTSLSTDLDWILRDEVVQITSKAEAGSDNVMDVYDVRDLTFAMTSFLPPEINTIPTDSLELRDRPRTGGEAEDKIRLVEPDHLVEVIKDATDREYWEGDSGASIQALDTGYLVVNASVEMHLRVARFLGVRR